MPAQTNTALGADSSTLSKPPPALSALELAKRIEVPRQLPVTHHGTPLGCLSDSSLALFEECRDAWRRRYLLGERDAPSGSMFLGQRIDEVLTTYYRALLDGGGPLNLEQLRECFVDCWRRALEDEQSQHGAIRWDEGTDEAWTFRVGLDAVAVCLRRIVPQLGTPLATQRRFEFRLAAGLEWTVLGFVDLDTVREQRVFMREDGSELAVWEPGLKEPLVKVPWSQAPPDLRPELTIRRGESEEQAAARQDAVRVRASRLAGEIVTREVVGIADYKAKRRAIYKHEAKGKSQPTLYLAERAVIRRQPVWDFTYAQVLKPADGLRVRVSGTVVRTQRSMTDLEAHFAYVAGVASTIDALYRTRGPDRPWGFAAPGSWRCEPNAERTAGKYCPHWATCPRGIGVGVKP